MAAAAHDYAVVGGGLLGLATAAALCERDPGARIVVLEKERGWAAHQSGRNSGVIHSGIYYSPGSLKARLAREGNRSLVRFCAERGVPFKICGKVIVAASEEELPRLAELECRARMNGVEATRLGRATLRELEPHVTGPAALHVPGAGVVDFRRVAESLVELLAERGAELRPGTPVEAIAARGDGVTLECAGESYRARLLINCAGLQSDRLARLCGVDPGIRIVPFRGEFHALRREREGLVRGLVYPVPDPRFPFLGAHFTRGIGGRVHVGPNAVLNPSREGYERGRIDRRDLADTLGYGGFWRLARSSWRAGAAELARSRSRRLFARSLRRLVPELTAEDLEPAGAGVRAQALGPDGRLIDDFLIVHGPRSVHVLNAPSPAATAALPIGRWIAERVLEQRPVAHGTSAR